jgi:hypothetical protein
MSNSKDRTSADIDWEAEFADDPDFQALPADAQKKLVDFMQRTLDMKLAVVYGDEDPDQPEACVDCNSLVSTCKAKCCTLMFALTKEEAEAGKVAYNEERPYFIARDKEDGYCPHLDRETYGCAVWHDRPIRCRVYSCETDSYIWPNGFGKPA